MMDCSIGPATLIQVPSEWPAGDPASSQRKFLDSVLSRLPAPNSLRRASVDTAVAVLAAADLLRSERLELTERVGVYVGQQQMALDPCEEFVQASYAGGPRMVSPMIFAESAANNVASHLSLTLRVKGSMQTFIGSRSAGIQAVAAAQADLGSGHVDAALVVVDSIPGRLTREVFRAIFDPYGRTDGRAPCPLRRGAAAMLLRPPGAGPATLKYAGSRFYGPGIRDQAAALHDLLAESDRRISRPNRVFASVFHMVRARGMSTIRTEAGPDILADEEGEFFALAPFRQLLGDGAGEAEARNRMAICLGEDGSAGVVSITGSIPVLSGNSTS
jgi:hypothetical protein